MMANLSIIKVILFLQKNIFKMNHNYVLHWSQLKELNVVSLFSYMVGFYKNLHMSFQTPLPLLNPNPFKDTVIYRFYFVNWIVLSNRYS